MAKKRSSVGYLLNPKNWWLPLLLIFIIRAARVISIGIHTYTGAPPIPTYIYVKEEVVFSKEDILNKQALFQKYALMEHGSMFGDGEPMLNSR